MTKQVINTGTSNNDGTGDTLKNGATKINLNFSELYTNLGNGTALQFVVDFTTSPTSNQILAYNSTTGKFLPTNASSTGSGNVNSIGGGYTDNAIVRYDGTSGNIIQTSLVTIKDDGAITAPQASSVIPFYYANVADFPSSATYHGAVAHAHSTGKLYYAHSGWNELANMTDIITGFSYSISATGSSNYIFSGPGIQAGNTDDPVLYLYRGFTYTFINTTGASHPFAIRVSNGGSAYTSGVSGSQTGTQVFEVPMNAPSTLYYQCTIHSGMGNTINIV